MYKENKIADNLIKNFMYIYFNPRANIDSVNKRFETHHWLVGSDVPYHKHEEPLYPDFNLEFVYDEKVYYVFEFLDIFYEGLNASELDMEEGIYNIAKSISILFYFPLSDIFDRRTFANNKPMAFFQLADNYPHLELNDAVRTSYIRFLFNNASLYEEVKFLTISKGRLYFKDNLLSSYYERMLLIENPSFIFKSVVNYCLSIIKFLETGLEGGSASLFDCVNIDDSYSKYSNYGFFIDDAKPKPYKYKNMISTFIEMQYYPKSQPINFINNMFLFNFINLIGKSDVYLKKYLKTDLEEGLYELYRQRREFKPIYHAIKVKNKASNHL